MYILPVPTFNVFIGIVTYLSTTSPGEKSRSFIDGMNILLTSKSFSETLALKGARHSLTHFHKAPLEKCSSTPRGKESE